jgi:hypothetical protein
VLFCVGDSGFDYCVEGQVPSVFSVEIMYIVGVVEDVVPKIGIIAAVRFEPVVVVAGANS